MALLVMIKTERKIKSKVCIPVLLFKFIFAELLKGWQKYTNCKAKKMHFHGQQKCILYEKSGKLIFSGVHKKRFCGFCQRQ
jgi:hypothetical protein